MVSGAKITIVDYQAGNLRSVQKALERFGVRPVISSDPKDIEEADGVVFPGQGAAGPAMRNLEARGLGGPIKRYIGDGRPFLGVCLGLQLLLDGSDEHDEACLGVLQGRVRRLPGTVKIPQMGWNSMELRSSHPIFREVPDGSYFYFVHSYYADPEESAVVAGMTTYGLRFASAVARDNLVAVQFHPEKSGAIGLRLYAAFVDMVHADGPAA